MNIIKRKTYHLSFDVWEPMTKAVEDEMDKLAMITEERL